MVGWFVLIQLIGGTVASWSVSRDASHFNVLQGVAAMLLLVLALFVLTI